MLILTRREDQEIVIGENVIVRVLEMRDGKVWLGITAPPEISVDRMEVRLRKEAEQTGSEITD